MFHPQKYWLNIEKFLIIENLAKYLHPKTIYANILFSLKNLVFDSSDTIPSTRNGNRNIVPLNRVPIVPRVTPNSSWT